MQLSDAVPPVTNADLKLREHWPAPGSTGALRILSRLPLVLTKEALSWVLPPMWKAANTERRHHALHEAGHIAVMHLCGNGRLEEAHIATLRHGTVQDLRGLFGVRGPEADYVRFNEWSMRCMNAFRPDHMALLYAAGFAAESTVNEAAIEIVRHGLHYEIDDMDEGLRVLKRMRSIRDACHRKRSYLQIHQELRPVFLQTEMQEYLQRTADYLCTSPRLKRDCTDSLDQWLATNGIKREQQTHLRNMLWNINVDDAIAKCAEG